MKKEKIVKDEVLIKLKQVGKTYPMGDLEVVALKDVCLEIYAGELLVILGPSGSGKTTLLNIIGGLDAPTSGEVWVGAKDLAAMGEKGMTLYRRRDVGFVFQFYNLLPDLTARENVELAASLVPDPLDVDKVLRDVGLYERKDHFPSQLSGGEQQRVSIARALVKRPKLILCDEPTGALDSEVGRGILGLLQEVNHSQGSTVVIVTHNTAIASMAQRVVRMSGGRVVAVTENLNPLPPERIEW